MESSKKLLNMLKKSELDKSKIHNETLAFLIRENFKNETQGIYTFADPEGKNYIGKSYAFLLTTDPNDCKLAINRKDETDISYLLTSTTVPEKTTRIYFGTDAVRALVKSIRIKNAIVEAESKGLYELAEHLTSSVDLEEE